MAFPDSRASRARQNAAMLEYRHLPHLQPFERNPIVFLTAVTQYRRRCLTGPLPFATLHEIWTNSARIDGWFVGDYLMMPDHTHLFARAAIDAKPLSEWIQTWKSISARRLAHHVLPAGAKSLWQEDYFDRFIRSPKDYLEKWDYVQMNPVRQELCKDPDSWPWKGRIHNLLY